MAKLNDAQMTAAFAPYLDPGEAVAPVAFGVKQPNVAIILLAGLAVFAGAFGLLAVIGGTGMPAMVLVGAIAGGAIALVFSALGKYYVIGLTPTRLLVLRVKSLSNATVKEVLRYDRAALERTAVRTSSGAIFTHIAIDDPQGRFVAKFHRGYSKTNRENAQAIAQAIAA
jgi:hypothetical protein